MVSGLRTSPKDQERIFSGDGDADLDGIELLVLSDLFKEIE
jgi:hypothetical protein